MACSIKIVRSAVKGSMMLSPHVSVDNIRQIKSIRFKINTNSITVLISSFFPWRNRRFSAGRAIQRFAFEDRLFTIFRIVVDENRSTSVSDFVQGNEFSPASGVDPNVIGVLVADCYRVAVQCGSQRHRFRYVVSVEPQTSLAGEHGNLSHVSGHHGVSSGYRQIPRIWSNDGCFRLNFRTLRCRFWFRFRRRRRRSWSRRSWRSRSCWWWRRPWSCGRRSWPSRGRPTSCSCRLFLVDGTYTLVIGLVYLVDCYRLDVGIGNLQVVHIENAGVFQWKSVGRFFGFQTMKIGFDGIRDAFNDS